MTDVAHVLDCVIFLSDIFPCYRSNEGCATFIIAHFASCLNIKYIKSIFSKRMQTYSVSA